MISVITPSFNQSAWLKLAIASVADQSGVEVEHIIQDALSSDGTRDWLERDQRVRAFFEKDAGMYDAINRGLTKARGEICAYLNCDEQYLPGALATVARFFTDNPETDVLFGDVILIDDTGRPFSYRRTVLPSRRHILLSHLNTASCATFFRRALFEQGCSFDPQWKAIGDAVWIDALLRRQVRMATIPEALAVFTFTGKNLGASNLAVTEGARWKGADSGMIGLRRASAIAWHRLRKAWAGAYQNRRLAIDIFTVDSPDRRQRKVGEKVGFRWPGRGLS